MHPAPKPPKKSIFQTFSRAVSKKSSHIDDLQAASKVSTPRTSRFSNVNLKVLNQQAEKNIDEFDETFMKETVLERSITSLTIKRTMTCFFMVVFSIPFFIPSTYKAYLSELEPFCNALETIRGVDPEFYKTSLLNFVEI